MADPFRIFVSLYCSPRLEAAYPEATVATASSSHSHNAAIPSSSLSLLSSAHLSLLPPIPSLDFSLRHVNPPSALTQARNQARVTARQEDHRSLNCNFCPRLRSPQSTPLPRFLPSLSFSPSLSLYFPSPLPSGSSLCRGPLSCS